MTGEQEHGLPKRKSYIKPSRNHSFSVTDLAEAIRAGSRPALAQAITLVESHAKPHMEQAKELLHHVLPYTGQSLRVGITGVPGAGKSTFIDTFGTFLCLQGYKVAVLAVDPSSKLTGGSILGDKTRMEKLSRHPDAFIRPSPTGGKLGGVHRKTKETIALCEAAGYDMILIETVGVGQSEVMVRDMVDFFLLLVLTGAGDELQGMKKGIMELADAIVVNKADGENEWNAKKTMEEYNHILHFLQPATKGWPTKAYTCSSLTERGMEELLSLLQQFKTKTTETGVFEQRRKMQTKDWLKAMILDRLESQFFYHPRVRELLPELENQMILGKLTVTDAVDTLFHSFNHPHSS